MVNRLTTAQSTVAMRRWGLPAIVTLAAMAALTALTVPFDATVITTPQPCRAPEMVAASSPIDGQTSEGAVALALSVSSGTVTMLPARRRSPANPPTSLRDAENAPLDW